MTVRIESRRVPLLACCVVAALLVSACAADARADRDPKGTVRVVASTDVWASAVRAVGGQHVSVTTIIDSSTADPHGYHATARDAADVLEADLVVRNGGGYDSFMVQLVSATDAHELSAFEVSGNRGNEHVWYDTAAVARVANAVADELAAARPDSASDFTDRAAAFTRRMDALADRVERVAPNGAGRVLSTSPVAHYLLGAAGVDNATPAEFTAAVEEGRDIPILIQQEVRRLLTSGAVDAVVRNAQTASPVVERLVAVAGRHGVPVVDVTETLPDGTTSYVAWMRGQVEALTGALENA